MRKNFKTEKLNSTSEFVEINQAGFDSVVDLIQESRLIDEKLMDFQNVAHFIKSKLESGKIRVLIQKMEEKPIAFAVLYHKFNALLGKNAGWHISYLYVKPSFRRKSIARDLLKQCIYFAITTKAVSLVLNTEASNYAAVKLYENLGFKRKNFTSKYLCYEMDL